MQMLTGIGAAAVFGAAAIEELLRLSLRAPWPGFPPLATDVVAIMLASLWALAAVSTVLRERAESLRMIAWMSARLGIIGLFGHGIITTWAAETVGTPRLGLLLVAASIGQIVLVKAAFGGIFFPRVAIPRTVAA